MTTVAFEGVGVALATFFGDDGALDVEATAEHAERLVQAGIRAIVTAGSTGEAPALDADERAALVRAVRQRLSDRVPVVAGTGDVTTDRAVAHTRAAVDAGADAVLALSPLRSNAPQAYYAAIKDAAEGRPVLAYHFPAMSPPGLAVEVLNELGVDGLKDSSGDAERLLIEAVRFDGALYTGAAPLLIHARAVGCVGAILALANLEPELCVAAFDGDADAQRALLDGHLELKADFPRGLKAVLHRRYGTSPVTRMG